MYVPRISFEPVQCQEKMLWIEVLDPIFFFKFVQIFVKLCYCKGGNPKERLKALLIAFVFDSFLFFYTESTEIQTAAPNFIDKLLCW